MSDAPLQADLPQLWERLSSPDRNIVASAVREAKQLSEEEMILLFRWAKASPSKTRRALTPYQHICCSIGLCSLGAIFFAIQLLFFGGNAFLSMLGMVAIFAGFALRSPQAVLPWYCFFHLLPKKIQLPETLEIVLELYAKSHPVKPQRKGSEFWQPLSWKELRDCLNTALKQSLPLINNEVASRLSTQERYTLYSFLASPYDDVELTIAILDAIPTLLDPEALPQVRALMSEGKASQNMQRVSYAASKCYGELKAGLAEKQDNALLLRPSSNASELERNLLRAAKDNPEDAQELLRPKGSE